MPWAKSFWAFSPYLNYLRNLSKESTLKSHFDNFFICNHLIIKWHFVGKRNKNYFFKWTQ